MAASPLIGGQQERSPPNQRRTNPGIATSEMISACRLYREDGEVHSAYKTEERETIGDEMFPAIASAAGAAAANPGVRRAASQLAKKVERYASKTGSARAPAAAPGQGGLLSGAVEGFKSVAARGLAYLSEVNPAAAQVAQQELTVGFGGKPISQLVNSKSPNTQQTVLNTLVRAGMDVPGFLAYAQLTREEANVHALVLLDAVKKTALGVDARQSPVVSSGDEYLDMNAREAEVEAVLSLLNITLDQYAMLLRCINTHTTGMLKRIQQARIEGKRPAL